MVRWRKEFFAFFVDCSLLKTAVSEFVKLASYKLTEFYKNSEKHKSTKISAIELFTTAEFLNY